MSEHVTTPTQFSYAAIGKYAEQVGQSFDLFSEGPRANIEGFIQSLGGTCELSEGRESLHVERPGKFTIFIPTSTSSRRDRFTKAHELGHYFLHYFLAGEAGEKAFGRGGRNIAETEANVFASSLLMPSQEFSDAWRTHEGNDVHVARLFDVSPAAARVRAQVLGL